MISQTLVSKSHLKLECFLDFQIKMSQNGSYNQLCLNSSHMLPNAVSRSSRKRQISKGLLSPTRIRIIIIKESSRIKGVWILKELWIEETWSEESTDYSPLLDLKITYFVVFIGNPWECSWGRRVHSQHFLSKSCHIGHLINVFNLNIFMVFKKLIDFSLDFLCPIRMLFEHVEHHGDQNACGILASDEK